MLSKEYKKGINKALNIIKESKRYDLEWEWISEDENGSYLDRQDIINKLLLILKEK